MASSPASFSPPGSPLPLTPADSVSSLSSIGKSRFGCTICRQQHLKCDRVLPVCGRCRVGGKRCTLPEMKIRNNCEDAKGKTKFVFPSGQTWAVVPDNLNFYNITGMVERDEPLEDENYVRAHADKIEDEPMSSVDTPTVVNTPLSAATPSASQSASVFSQPTSVFSQPTSVSQPLSLSIQDMLASSDSISAPPSPLYQVKSPTDRLLSMSPDSVTNCDSIPICINFPLPANSVEAVVWRHYIKHLANWLDMCDPKRSFEKIIPKMAMGSTVLRDAIFALSARHLAHLTRNTNERYSKALKTRAFLYHDQCCKALCHYIGFESLKTEPCFGAAIILRVVEEIEATRLELDKAIHLGGIRAFAGQYAERQVEGQVNDYMGGIRAFVKEFATNQRNDLGKGSLCAALYWVGLRQEIYSAVMHKRAASGFPTEIPLVKDLESKKSLEDDYDWANLAVVHCAKVLNYCYQYEEERQTGPVDPEERWQELRAMNAFWWAGRPFRPSIVDGADTGSFPETMYNSNCEAIGLQHFLLATLFLEENQPHVVASGGKLTQDRVEGVVREICGIGLMHQDSAPCMFTACMAISAFGDRFTELRDQQAMVRILEQTEAEHARPTYQVQGKLRRVWEWEE